MKKQRERKKENTNTIECKRQNHTSASVCRIANWINKSSKPKENKSHDGKKDSQDNLQGKTEGDQTGESRLKGQN